MINQKMRTVTMSRSDMGQIITALTSVMYSFDTGPSGRKIWAKIRADLIAQIEAQDQVSKNI